MEHSYQIEWQDIPLTITHKLKYISSYDPIDVRAKQPLAAAFAEQGWIGN